jgi:hypothetical protein
MKLTKTTLLPYPVFGIEDDYDCQLPDCYWAISSESNDKKHIVKCTISFEAQKIKNLLGHIERGRAILSFELDCLHTLTRYCERIAYDDIKDFINKGEMTFEINLDKTHFAKEVSLTPFITAIEDFQIDGDCYNEAYGENPKFSIEAGDVLAVFPTINIDITLDWKHMFNNAGAPIRIEEASAKDAVIETILANEIIVKLPTKEYRNFKNNLEHNFMAAPIILMSLARPAIMTALNALLKEPGNSSAWAMALKNRIDCDNMFEEFRPSDGDWINADLSDWDGKVERIASLIFKGAEEKMFKNLKEIADQQD